MVGVFKSRLIFLGSFLIGLFNCLLVTHFRTLQPTSIDWLSHGPNTDPIQAYLGWKFFRSGGWSIPLGSNPRFGELTSNSIAYSDSLPILALPFKLIEGYLPSEFQYFGIWLLISCVMFTYFVMKILILYKLKRSEIYLGCALISFSPIMLSRINIHFALAGQFLLVAALYFSLKSVKGIPVSIANWLILLIAAFLTHGYLFFMSLIFFIFDQLLQCRRNYITKKDWLVYIFLTLVTLLVVGKWVVGYSSFAPADNSTNYWGASGWNLLSPFYPNGWSQLLRNLPTGKGNIDTAPYFGLGICLCILIASALIAKRFSFYRILSIVSGYRYLVSALLLLTLFAITNRISVGNTVVELPFPKSFVDIFSPFRASARMSWPLLFAVAIGSVIVISRTLTKTIGTILLVTLCAVQYADTWPGWRSEFAAMTSSSVFEVEAESSWRELSAHYSRLVVVPDKVGETPGWPSIAVIAAKFGMTTNSAYLARVQKQEFINMRQKIIKELRGGNPRRDTIYVLSNEMQIGWAKGLVRENSMHAITKVGGFQVLLPYAKNFTPRI